MKKYILLTTTAMLLSAVALKANADSNSAQLDIRAMFVAPFEITEEQYLSFGMFLINGPNKTITVTTDGNLDSSSTATMLSTATYQHIFSDGGMAGSFNEAVFRIDYGTSGEGEVDITVEGEDQMNALWSVNFADTEVDLFYDESDPINTKCGTVSRFTTRLKPSVDGSAKLHIGGTFTTADLDENNIVCGGSTTITLVLNDTFLENNGLGD